MRRSRGVDLDDAGGDFVADLEHVLDLLDALLADLGDVDQTFELVGQLDERAERGELDDLAFDEVAHLVTLLDVAATDRLRAVSCRATSAGWRRRLPAPPRPLSGLS